MEPDQVGDLGEQVNFDGVYFAWLLQVTKLGAFSSAI